MAVVFEQPSPIGTMQAAATAKLQYEQELQNRDYQLKQQEAQASLYHQAQQTRLAQQGMAQSAYEFDARQQPSARDVFEADQQAAAQDRGFAQHSALQSQALSQAETMRLSSLQRQSDYVQQQVDNGAMSQADGQNALTQLNTGINPLQERQQRAQAQAHELQLQTLQDQRAREVAMNSGDVTAMAQVALRNTFAGEQLWPNDPSTHGRNFYVNPHSGEIKPISEPRTAADEAAYATAHAGMSRANIQDAVVDSYRENMRQAGMPFNMSDEEVRQSVDPQQFARAVRDEEQRRSSPRGAQLTANGRAAAETHFARMANADLVRYNQGQPSRPGGPVPQRPSWVQEYLQQLSPLERAADNWTGGNLPIPASVLSAAQKWKVARDMASFQRVGNAVASADNPGEQPSDSQPSGGGAAPNDQSQQFNQLLDRVSNPDGSRASPIAGERLSALRTAAARTWNNDIPLINRIGRGLGPTVPLVGEIADILGKADDAGRPLTVAEAARYRALLGRIQQQKTADEQLARRRRAMGGLAPTGSAPGTRLSYQEILNRLQLDEGS